MAVCARPIWFFSFFFRILHRWLHAGQAHAQGGVGHFQHIVAHIGHHAHIGRHARQQLAAGVGKGNHRDVGDHVAHVLPGLAHQADLALEGLAGEGIHREAGFLAGADAAHIGLVDAGIHLHVRQVLRNHKQLGRLQAGGHRLAALHRALDDDAVDRRFDLGAPQIHPSLGQHGFFLRHAGLRRLDLRFGHTQLGLGRLQQLLRRGQGSAGAVGLALRDEAPVHQLQVAVVDALGLGHIGLRPRNGGPAGSGIGLRRQHIGAGGIHIGLGRAHAVLVGFGVDLGNQLTRFHLGIEIGQHLAHLPADLAADRHLRDRIDRARSRHRGLQRPTLNLPRAPGHHRPGLAVAPPPRTTASGERQHHRTHDPT